MCYHRTSICSCMLSCYHVVIELSYYLVSFLPVDHNLRHSLHALHGLASNARCVARSGYRHFDRGQVGANFLLDALVFKKASG